MFTGETVRQFFIGPFETRELIKQGYYIGNKTLPLVSITGFFLGLVLTLQTRPVLVEFGAQSMLPGMIAVSIIREIGPMVTALLCAGKISSGIGAELGAMKVTEQLDAMEVSGTQPLNYVVATRVMATTLLVPILVFFADAVALTGSYFAVNMYENISLMLFFSQAFDSLDFIDFIPATIKTFFFGFFIGLIAAGLFLFAVAIFYLGSQQNLFSSTVSVKSYFEDVRGLMEGNKVQYSGITVGHVAHIEIINDTTVLVEMSVNRDVQKFIRIDSKVDISSDGLMGSKIVNIYPGSASAQSITDDDVLMTQESVDFEDVLEEALSVIEESRLIVNNLLKISNKMNSGKGDFALLLNERNITSKLDRVENEMLVFTSTANEIIDRINQGEGDLGRLINDSTITFEYQKLMTDMDSVVQKSDLLVSELNQYSKQLNRGNGILYRIAYDSVMAANIDTAVFKINKSVDDVVEAAKAIDNSWIFNLFSNNKD